LKNKQVIQSYKININVLNRLLAEVSLRLWKNWIGLYWRTIPTRPNLCCYVSSKIVGKNKIKLSEKNKETKIKNIVRQDTLIW